MGQFAQSTRGRRTTVREQVQSTDKVTYMMGFAGLKRDGGMFRVVTSIHSIRNDKVGQSG